LFLPSNATYKKGSRLLKPASLLENIYSIETTLGYFYAGGVFFLAIIMITAVIRLSPITAKPTINHFDGVPFLLSSVVFIILEVTAFGLFSVVITAVDVVVVLNVVATVVVVVVVVAVVVATEVVVEVVTVVGWTVEVVLVTTGGGGFTP
jgi:hypothetical protein